MKNVIEFTKGSDQLIREIDQLLAYNKKGVVTNLVLSYMVKSGTDDCEHPRHYFYWFGDSALMCLGMLKRMGRKINNWIEGIEDE